ncbi:hypothetical protein H4R19_003248 [Coemansia spiralis]|nr:hypothetical protein H4R19_003248 [Coemansia spiralis]
MGEAGPSASKLDRFLNRLSRTMTPPKASIRSRRGVSPPAPLEAVGGGGQVSTPEGTGDTGQRHHSESARTTTLRKREKIAELRRRRQQDLEQRRQSQYTAMSPAAGAAPGAASMAALAAVVSPLGPGQPPFPVPQSARWGPAGMGEDRFFDSPELNLLLQPIDLDSVVCVVDPTPPSQRTPAKRPGQRSAARDELDFTIDIPSTSLSPTVPLGLGHGRQRSRATGRDHGAPPAGSAVPASDGRVFQHIEDELARNRALKRELARLGAIVQALETIKLREST